MELEYFDDTDTLMITLSERPITDHIDVNENMLVELDDSGKIVAVTIEHAKEHTDVNSFLYKKAS